MCIFLKECFKSVDSIQNISSGIRNKTRVLTLAIFIHYSIRKPSHGNQTGRRNKKIQTGREEYSCHCLQMT